MAVRIILHVKRRIKYEKDYKSSRVIMGRDMENYPETIGYSFRRLAEEMNGKLNINIGEENYPACTFVLNDEPGIWYFYQITHLE